MNRKITVEMANLSPFWNEADNVPLEMAKSHSLQHTWFTKGLHVHLSFSMADILDFGEAAEDSASLIGHCNPPLIQPYNVAATKEIKHLSSICTIPQSALPNLIWILCFLICAVIKYWNQKLLVSFSGS